MGGRPRRLCRRQLDLVALRGTEITEVVSFLTPEIFSMFGLPDELTEERRSSDEFGGRRGLYRRDQ
jgi:hypothetical protein